MNLSEVARRANNTPIPRLGELMRAGRLVRRKLPTGEEIQVVEKAMPCIIRGLSKDGTLTVVASDETVDRYGDVIKVSGWKLGEYRKNPVILVDHWYTVEAIVGQATRTYREDRQLLQDVKLDPPESSPASRLVHNKLAAKSLRTVSVGFIPRAWEKIYDEEERWTGGFLFKESELLETSFVAVPANPSALVQDGAESPDTTGKTDAVLSLDAARSLADRFDAELYERIAARFD